jgi:hypothetical protein
VDHLVPVRVDHHVHLNSPAIQAFLPDFCASVRRFGPCDPALTTPHSVQDLLAEMDRAGIQRAVVLSNGYLAESPMMDSQRPDAADLMRAANDWTVELFPPSSRLIQSARQPCLRSRAGVATLWLPA